MLNNAELTFDDFRQMASDPSLSKYEKIGFPDSYRKGIESLILDDITGKLGLASTTGKMIADIGCGCSDLVLMEIDFCQKHNHQLLLVDSEEMLSLVPTGHGVEKIPGYFPEIPMLFDKFMGKLDCIIAYSVLHYVYSVHNLDAFIQRSVVLLRPGGQMLLGDVPNQSKRNRFLATEEGKKFTAHSFSEKGSTAHGNMAEKIDDSVIFSILQKFRNLYCETFLLPQNEKLPMANRRDDILIVKGT